MGSNERFFYRVYFLSSCFFVKTYTLYLKSWLIYFFLQLNDIDLIMATLETSVGSIGGFCAGTTYVIEHQTLAGLGKELHSSFGTGEEHGALASSA